MTGSPLFPLLMALIFIFGPLLEILQPKQANETVYIIPAHHYYEYYRTDNDGDKVSAGYYIKKDQGLPGKLLVKLFNIEDIPPEFDPSDGEKIKTHEWDLLDNHDGCFVLTDHTKDAHGCDVYAFNLQIDNSQQTTDNKGFYHKLVFQDALNNIVSFYLRGYNAERLNLFGFTNKNVMLECKPRYGETIVEANYECKTEKQITHGYWDIMPETNGNLYGYDYEYRSAIYLSPDKRSKSELHFDVICSFVDRYYSIDHPIDDYRQTETFVYYSPNDSGDDEPIDAIKVTFGLEETDDVITAKVISDEHIPVSELYMLK